MKKILVVGDGGREAALAWKLKEDTGAQVFCAPGNAGIAEYATCIQIAATDIDALLTLANEEQIDLTVVGPEGPLTLGITDRFRAERLAICGVTRRAAQLGGLKRS